MDVFGADYPTPDGTCIRDYIHVADRVAAHSDALAYPRDGGASATLNCGYGRGSSVLDAIDTVKRAGLAVPIHAISDGGVDTIGTAAQLDMSETIVRHRSAPGFFDFQRHRFAERLEGRLDLIEARGMVEPEQTVDGFSIPAETAHQLGAGDAALPQRAV
jgi:hypothetical protein